MEALLQRLDGRVRLGAHVEKVVRRPDTETVELRTEDGAPAEFDHVVLATHSDQALRLLADPSDAEREVLGAIRYQPNQATLHTDRRLPPRNPRAWASWNYHRTRADTGRAMVTYHLNRLQGIESAGLILVTLNRDEDIDPAAVLARFEYDHPAFDAAAVRAQRRRDEISGRDGTSFAGACWSYRFHEDGVQSALHACRALGSSRRGDQRPLRGHAAPSPPLALARVRPTPSPCPTSTWRSWTRSSPGTRCGPWSARTRCRSGGPTSWATPPCARHRRLGPWPEQDGPATRRPHPAARPGADVGAGCSTPSPCTSALDESGSRVDALVLHVTNTPWHERHAYVIDGGVGEHRFPKRLHVSPFFGMDQEYRLRVTQPGDRLTVSLAALEGGRVVFDASLVLRRRPISRAALGRVLWRYLLAHPAGVGRDLLAGAASS